MRTLTIGLLILVVVVGCGGPKTNDAAVGVPTRGIAVFGDKPAAGAILLFHGSGTGIPPRTSVQTDGKFEVPASGGLAEGVYVVTVEWRIGADENGDVRKSIAPDRYTRKESSPLRATVKPRPDGQCDLGTLAITK